MAEKSGPSKTAAQRSQELGSYFTESRLRSFSFDYKRYPQLWSKSQDQNGKTPHGLGACSGLALRLRLPRGEGTCERVLSLCRHFHRLLFQQLLEACRKTDGSSRGRGAGGAGGAELPLWARYADGYLNMHGAALKAYKAAKNKHDLVAIMESATIPMPVHAAKREPRPRHDVAGARLVRALRRARGQGFSAAVQAAARALRRGAADVGYKWSCLRRMAQRRLRSLIRHSDRADATPRPPSALDWAAADLAVYFGADVLARKYLTDEACLAALLHTFRLVQRRGLEAPGAPPAPERWAAAAAEYGRRSACRRHTGCWPPSSLEAPGAPPAPERWAAAAAEYGRRSACRRHTGCWPPSSLEAPGAPPAPERWAAAAAEYGRRSACRRHTGCWPPSSLEAPGAPPAPERWAAAAAEYGRRSACRRHTGCWPPSSLEAPGAPPAPERWAAAAAEYGRSGHTCSALVLQRRWYELKKAARRALTSAWRGERAPAPEPLLLAIARRYPHVVTEPPRPWAELVRRGAVARPTSERGPARAADSSDAESDKDDDLILVEETIETITLDEDNGPKTPPDTPDHPTPPPPKHMPSLDSEETLPNPFPPDKHTESLNNDPVFNENNQDEDTELRCDEETPESPHSDNVVEALKSLDVGAVQMTIQFDDDDEFDDKNEVRGATETVSESEHGNNDVTVKDKNHASKSNGTVKKTCDTGNDSQNVGLLKIRDVTSMQIESRVNKTPVFKRTDARIQKSRRICSESSDSDSDNLTIDTDYVPRDDVSEDEDPNQGNNNSHADNLNTHSSNINKENVTKTTHLGNQPKDLNKIDKAKIDGLNVANNYLQNNSMVVDTEKLTLTKMIKEKSVDKDTSTLDSENTSDEEVSNKKSNATHSKSNGTSSEINETDIEKLDLLYVRSLVRKLLQYYGCHSESNEISKTDEQMSEKHNANVPTEAAQSGHVPNLRILCKNKIGSLLTSGKSDSSNNDTGDVSKSKAESDLTEAATTKENDKLGQELTSDLKNEVPITYHKSNTSEILIRDCMFRENMYSVKVGAPKKNITNKVDEMRFFSGTSNIANEVKELKLDLKVKPSGHRLKSCEDIVLFMAPNKEIVEKCATKSFHKIIKPNSSKGSETCTSKDTTDSQTGLAKMTENITIQSPSSDNTVKGHVIKNPILLRMLKSQTCDLQRSLQFASSQNRSNAIDIEDETDDVLMTEDEVRSEIDPKLLMCPVVELEKVNLALMFRHWREVRRISLYDAPPTYLFKKSNLTLLKKCRPCGVPLQRRDAGARGRAGSRVAKKVELQNIDDVRRNNRNILTAQVAPITVDPKEASSAAIPTNIRRRRRDAGLSADDLRELLQRYSDCASGKCGRCARCLARPAPPAAACSLSKERRNRARQRHKERNKRPRSPYEEDPEEAKRRWIREKNVAAEKFGVKPRVLKKRVEQPPPPPPPHPPATQTLGHLIMSSIEKIDSLNQPSGNYVINSDGSIHSVDVTGVDTDNINANISNTSQNPPTVPLILNQTTKLQASTFLPLTVEHLLEHAKNQPIYKLDSSLFNPDVVANINKTLNNLTDTEPAEFNPVITDVKSLADTEANRKKQNLLDNVIPQSRKRHFDSSLEEPPKKAFNTTQNIKLAKPQGNALKKPTDKYPKFKIVTKNVVIKSNQRFDKVAPAVPNLIPLKSQAVENVRERARKQLCNLKTVKFCKARRKSLEITLVQAAAPPTNLNQTNLQNIQNSQGFRKIAQKKITQIPSCDLQSTQTTLQTNLQNAQSPDSDMQKTTPQSNLQTIDLQNAQNVPWNVQSVQTSPQTNLQSAQSSNGNMPETTRQINLLNAQTSQSIQAVSQKNLQCVQNAPVTLQAQGNSQMNFQNVQINQQINLQNVQTNSQMTLQSTQTNHVNYIWTNTQPGATADLTNQIKILNHHLPTNQQTIPLQFNTAQQVSTTLNSNFNVILSNSHQNTLQVNTVLAGPSLINSYLPNELGLLSNQVMPLNSVQAGPPDNSVLVVPAQDNLNTLSEQLLGPPLPVTAVRAGPPLQGSADKAETTPRAVRERSRLQYFSSQFIRGQDIDPLSMPAKTAAQYVFGRDPTKLALLVGRWPRGELLLLREPSDDVPGPLFGLAPPCRILQDEETPLTPDAAKSKPPWLKVRSFARLPAGAALAAAQGAPGTAPRRVFLHDKVYHKLADSPLIYAKLLAPLESPRQLRALVGALRPLHVYCSRAGQLYSLRADLSRCGSNIIISGPKVMNSVIADISQYLLSQSGVAGDLLRVSGREWTIPRRAVAEDNSGNNNKPRILNGQLPSATLHYRPEASAADAVIDLDSD